MADLYLEVAHGPQQTRKALRVYTLPTEYYCPTFTASAVVPWWMSELRDGKKPVWPAGWTFTSVDLDRLSHQWDREGKLAPPFEFQRAPWRKFSGEAYYRVHGAVDTKPCHAIHMHLSGNRFEALKWANLTHLLPGELWSEMRTASLPKQAKGFAGVLKAQQKSHVEGRKSSRGAKTSSARTCNSPDQ